jgi:hypothetical protein
MSTNMAAVKERATFFLSLDEDYLGAGVAYSTERGYE